MELQEVKVLVPSDRITEFYRWFADWSEGRTEVTSSAGLSAPTDQLTIEAATAWWRKLKATERAIWGLWVDRAPDLIPADEIISELGLSSTRVIPGALSWSGRRGTAVGFRVHWDFDNDPITGKPRYGLRAVGGLSAIQYAELLRQARSNAEGN